MEVREGKKIGVKHRGRTYRFRWTKRSGWLAINQNGRERASQVPLEVLKVVSRRYGEATKAKEK